MNTSTEHFLQSNQSEPLADASGRIVDPKNENGAGLSCHQSKEHSLSIFRDQSCWPVQMVVQLGGTRMLPDLAQHSKHKNICITFLQRRPKVFDVGPTLHKCYTNT